MFIYGKGKDDYLTSARNQGIRETHSNIENAKRHLKLKGSSTISAKMSCLPLNICQSFNSLATLDTFETIKWDNPTDAIKYMGLLIRNRSTHLYQG